MHSRLTVRPLKRSRLCQRAQAQRRPGGIGNGDSRAVRRAGQSHAPRAQSPRCSSGKTAVSSGAAVRRSRRIASASRTAISPWGRETCPRPPGCPSVRTARTWAAVNILGMAAYRRQNLQDAPAQNRLRSRLPAAQRQLAPPVPEPLPPPAPPRPPPCPARRHPPFRSAAVRAMFSTARGLICRSTGSTLCRRRFRAAASGSALVSSSTWGRFRAAA